MLTEAEFATHVNGYCQCGCTDPLIEHDRAQRAEIELLRDIIRRAAWLEQAPEEGSPYIDFESYARATEESEALRARAEKAEAERDRYLAAIREWEGADDAHAKKAFARSYRADTRSRLEAAEAALRAIVVKVIDRADDRECPAAALEMARAAIKKAEGRSK